MAWGEAAGRERRPRLRAALPCAQIPPQREARQATRGGAHGPDSGSWLRPRERRARGRAGDSTWPRRCPQAGAGCGRNQTVPALPQVTSANGAATAVGSRLQTRAHWPARSLAQLRVGLPAPAGTVTLFHDPHAPPGPTLCRATCVQVQARPAGGAVATPTLGRGTWATRGPAHSHWLHPPLSEAPPTPPDSSPSCRLAPCSPPLAPRPGTESGLPLAAPPRRLPPLPRGRPENPERGSTAPPGRATALGMLSSRGRFFGRK